MAGIPAADRRRKPQNGLPEVPGYRLIPKRQRKRGDPLGEHWLEIMTEARELGLSGAADFEVAQHFGVPTPTISNWKRRHPEFAAALRSGKDIADGLVEASLYHKARGYSYKSEKNLVVDGKVERVPTIEHVPPTPRP